MPTLLGVGQYTLYAELPPSGGLYATANVTYRGIQIGTPQSKTKQLPQPRPPYPSPSHPVDTPMFRRRLKSSGA